MNILKSFWLTMRRQSLVLTICLATLAMLLFKLSSITAGNIADAELLTKQASESAHTVVTSPLFMPLNGLRWVSLKLLGGHTVYALRLPSVLLGAITILSLIYITRRWYGKRMMLLGIALIMTSAWILHIGRLGTNDVAYLSAIPILLATNLLLNDYTDKKIVLWIWVIITATLLYIPGAIWLILAAIVWQFSVLRETWAQHRIWERAAIVLLMLVLLAPFAYGMIHNANLQLLVTWLGLPTVVPSWHEPVKNLLAALSFVFVRTPADPVRWLGKLPLLDAFMAISFIAGIVFYIPHIRASRTQLLLIYGVISLLLCAAGGSVSRSLLVPLVYLVAFGGIAYILHQWLKIFPRNPLARRLGIGLLGIAVVLSCAYNLRQYFVAWQHNPDTVHAYSIKP